MEEVYILKHLEPGSKERFHLGIELKGDVPPGILNLKHSSRETVCELAINCIFPKEEDSIIAIGTCDEDSVTALAIFELRARDRLDFDHNLVHSIGQAHRCGEGAISKKQVYKVVVAIMEKCRDESINLEEKVHFVYRCLLGNFTWFEIHELVGEYERRAKR